MNYLLILSFLSFGLTAQSQCCPYINNIEVIPAVPTSTDNVKIVTTVTTPSQGVFISSSHSVNGNAIDIEACYYNGFLTATQTYYDTLDIGLLSPGVFSINLLAFTSTSDTVCTYADSNTSNLNITVLDLTNDLPSIEHAEIGRLYPNPASGTFVLELPSDVKATEIRIRTISGKLVHQGNYQKEISVDFESGMYIIEVMENNAILGYQRLLID